MPLTPKQQRFVSEYLIDLNATQAAIRAGYSRKTANVTGPQNLVKPSIASAIAERTKHAQNLANVTREQVLRELAFVAFQRAGSIYRADGTLKSPHEWDEATAATIAGIETEEEVEVTDATDEREPQSHGGTLKRKRGAKVATRTCKVKRWDKVRALELFMRHFGMLTEDAPHPDRFPYDLTRLSDDDKRALLHAFRVARSGGHPPGSAAPAGGGTPALGGPHPLVVAVEPDLPPPSLPE